MVKSAKATAISVQMLCRVALMTAIYVLLAMMAPIETGTLKITLASLPVVIAGAVMGPMAGFLTGFLGEFVDQMLGYGFTATTLLWLIPVGLRGAIIGWMLPSGAVNKVAWWRWYTACVVAALATTVVNTGVLWLDSVLYGYYTPALIWGAVGTRLITGVVTAVVVGTLANPLCRSLDRLQHNT